MKNQLQNRGKWTTLFLLALLLTGGTTMKAQTWAYFAEDHELVKSGVTLKNVTVKAGTEKELVIGNNSDLTVTSLDMTGAIADGYIVTEIGTEAFSGLGLTSFVCPTDLKVIGEGAFSICTSLVSVTFNDKLVEIGKTAFDRTLALTSVVLPQSLTTIGEKAFNSCGELVSVILPEGSMLSSIGASAFTRCGKLTTFTFPAGVTKINSFTFSNSGLTSITLPATITEISESGFGFSKALTRIDCLHTTEPALVSDPFVGGPEDRKVYAFNADPQNWNKAKWGAKEIIYEKGWEYDADARTLNKGEVTLKNITLKAGTEKELIIGDNADLTVTNLDMSGGIDGDYLVTEIAEYAFSGTSLVSITLPADLKVIGEGAFSICTSLVSVTFNDKLVEIGKTAFDRTLALTTVVLPQSLTTIGDKAFNSCGELASVILPEGSMLSSIGASAFTRCGKLTTFTFPAGVTKINSFTFSNSGLTSITLPATITEISESGFGFSKALSKIVCLHTTQPTLASDAFVGGPEDRKVYAFNADPQNWDKAKWGAKEIIYVKGWEYDADAKTLNKGEITLKNVTVKAGTEKELVIGDNADLAVTDLDMSGDIGGGYLVTEIAEYAFSGTSLVSITLPADLKVIGEGAFSICTSLVSVTFNDKLLEIGNTAFDRTLALTTVVLPQSLTTIGDKAFNSCGELATVTLPEGSLLSSIGASAFTRCGKLTAFTFPAGVTKINNFTFSNSGLTSITLPATITEISESGFGFCKALTRIDCLHTTEPALVSDPFVGGPEGRKVYALNANPQNWDKEKWGAEEIIYTLNSIGTVDGEQVRVWVDGGVLQIVSPVAAQVRIAGIDGISRDLGVVNGKMQVTLPDGISIVIVGDLKYKVVK